jgi:hypothetical protein
MGAPLHLGPNPQSHNSSHSHVFHENSAVYGVKSSRVEESKPEVRLNLAHSEFGVIRAGYGASFPLHLNNVQDHNIGEKPHR